MPQTKPTPRHDRCSVCADTRRGITPRALSQGDCHLSETQLRHQQHAAGRKRSGDRRWRWHGNPKPLRCSAGTGKRDGEVVFSAHV